jgi:hypothetical protein
MKRLYHADIFKCEDMLFESHEALVAYADKFPQEFIVYTDVDIEKIFVNDNVELQIDYIYHEDGMEDSHRTDTFDIECRTMTTLVLVA